MNQSQSTTYLKLDSILWVIQLLLIGFLLSLCDGSRNASKEDRFITKASRLSNNFRVFQNSDADIRGLSGLTMDDAFTLWAVPEDDRVLLPLRFQAGKLTIGAKPVKIIGVDGDLDIESVAFIGPTEFVIGTEGAGERPSDKIFWLKVHGGQARITKTLIFSYVPWSINAKNNQGIEGICYINDQLVVAGEPVALVKGKRYAPLGRYDMKTGIWYFSRLHLTTKSGKISALSCRMKQPARLEVFAVERHYGIARILSFSLVLRPAEIDHHLPMDVFAKVIFDFSEAFDSIPNCEGLVFHQGRFFLITDNHHTIVVGPTYLIQYSPTH